VLAAGHRLRRRAEFAAAVRGARRGARGALVVHFAVPDPPVVPNPSETDRPVQPARAGVPQEPPPRAGFVVSRAVGGAVIRNTVRRRLRHLVAERIPDLPAGATLVVRALPEAAGASYARLAADLDAALAAARSPRPERRGARR
jgi:ribonuclease P protein component